VTDDRNLLYAEIDARDRLSRTVGDHPDRLFVSGSSGENPFAADFLGPLAANRLADVGDFAAYSHLTEDRPLATSVAELHRQRYGESLISDWQIVPGAGAAGFLTTLLMFQHLRGVSEIHYLPPMYYSAAWWVRQLGFGVHRVTPEASFAADPPLALPSGPGLLWITDPLWFAGHRLTEKTITRIAEWQRATGSTVVVDGTFQYMRWDGSFWEPTSRLDPGRTFRLVCPTKALGLHGLRFAYVIAPPRHSADLAELHGRLHGSAGLVDVAFAHRAVEVLRGPSGAAPLLEFARQRYRRLTDQGAIAPAVEPTSGYLAFVRPSRPGRFVGMGPDCFGIAAMADCLRVNLLDSRVVAALAE
jgi:histidinol-phosphate/aromatic aminotransferase/cobyric acid decarboxylase-like protein